VGINSGEVLAGRVGDGYTVIGDPVNVAARLQAAAQPGTVIVGEVTHRLTRKAIEYVELEPLELKGKAERVPAWEAVRAVVRGRSTRASTATPLVGRQVESERLLALFDQVVSEQRPHLVTVIGQAGVGKSRLLRELTLNVGGRERAAGMRLRSSSTRREAPRHPSGQLPCLRRGARLLGARRDRARNLRDRRHRRRKHRLAEAARWNRA